MRTPYRIVTTLVAVAAAIPFGLASTAHADETQPAVVQGSWYWADQSMIVGPEVVNPPQQLSGVPAKQLAVAYTGKDGTNPDKVTYLAWDVSAIPAGSTVAKFEFTIPVSTDPTAVQVTPPDYKLVACAAIGDFTPVEGGGFNQKPADDCSLSSTGTYDATAKAWTFEVAAMADRWAKGDPPSGIGILPDPDTKTPFQVVFQAPATVKTVAEFTLPAPVVPTTAPTPEPVPSAPAFVSNGNTGVALPPAVPVTVPQPVAQPQPSAAPPTVALTTPTRPVVPARALAFPKSSGLPAAFWGGALAAVALLGLASLMLGDATVAVQSTRGRAVTRSLRERQVAQRGTLSRTRTRVRTV
ncbi:MAG TPA: hypothetical protein VFQ85_02250 [Mycobacteriales bacterium]|nr:hypothetical protein [Mycobacteriales bacterium]